MRAKLEEDIQLKINILHRQLDFIKTLPTDKEVQKGLVARWKAEGYGDEEYSVAICVDNVEGSELGPIWTIAGRNEEFEYKDLIEIFWLSSNVAMSTLTMIPPPEEQESP